MVQKELTKDGLVICDSLNYIKGFRYELFCVGKLVQTTFAVIHCDAVGATCSWLNSQKPEVEKYPAEKIEELLMRYERPEAKNRWDSPLYVVKIGKRETAELIDPEDMSIDFDYPSPRFADVPLGDIYSWLVEGKALEANLSTQSAPLAATNFLHELDRVTQEIVASIMEQQRMAVIGDRFLVPHALEGDENKVVFKRTRTLPELSRLRRQFITYTKMHPIEGSSKIASLFVNFVNSNC
ncbi:hypothetical protein L596_018311 [Steinernema carpocapsae]|uniref:Protein KTI12 homolog n=1 Tax=Steinernema carpocapsae TaxID=34508 RepID=A0A4U5N4Q7_STECR|nr:hypothetical protein L596_018311 [Steinernema carpocapsae]